MARLGVNIDHVATLRQQRGEDYPSVQRAAEVVLKAGADQITIHLREDRRHIQDADVPLVHEVCRQFGRPLNLEIGCAPEIVQIACRERPEWVCLVPEKREERTTEGGLAMTDETVFNRVRIAIDQLRLHSPMTKVSLFVEDQVPVLWKCFELDIHAVEIHTGNYARDFLEGKLLDDHLEGFALAHSYTKKAGRGFHAGHGLTDMSVKPLVEQNLFEEYNIGHWIVAESVFQGLAPVVRELAEKIRSKA